jgi:hypothetical protein
LRGPPPVDWRRGPRIESFLRNQIEIFIDVDIADVAIGYMHSPEFAANPIGGPFDVDNLIARYESGESIESLLVQPELDEDALEDLIDKLVAGMTGEA